MRYTAKLIAVSLFALVALFMFLSSNNLSSIGATVFSGAEAQPTPPKKKKRKPANSNSNTQPGANSIVNANPTNANLSTFPFGRPTSSPSAVSTPEPVKTATNTASNTSTAEVSVGGKSIPKTFTLGQDSQSEFGEVAFDHDSHAFKNYSPDGKSAITCVECHHTDQPKSALKPPLLTSERDEILTFAVFQRSTQRVSECRACHFQDGNVPDGKTMPKAGRKELNNMLAYHINCNTCHDAAFKARKDIKDRNKTFATGRDCAVCHKTS